MGFVPFLTSLLLENKMFEFSVSCYIIWLVSSNYMCDVLILGRFQYSGQVLCLLKHCNLLLVFFFISPSSYIRGNIIVDKIFDFLVTILNMGKPLCKLMILKV